MSIRKEEAFQHVLCLHLQPHELSLAVMNKDSKKIRHQQTLAIKDFDRDGVTSILNEEYLSYDYHALCAVAGGTRSTLIPVDLFNHTKAEDVFKLNYPAPIDNLDYNRIPEIGIVNIFELPLWMKSLFVIKFPRIKVVHPATVILKGIFNQPTFTPKMHLVIEGNSFYFLITAKSKLIYYNRFDFTTIADLVYHVLFVLEQKELDQKTMDLFLYGVAPNWSSIDELQGFFKNKIRFGSGPENTDHFLLAKQLLCV